MVHGLVWSSRWWLQTFLCFCLSQLLHTCIIISSYWICQAIYFVESDQLIKLQSCFKPEGKSLGKPIHTTNHCHTFSYVDISARIPSSSTCRKLCAASVSAKEQKSFCRNVGSRRPILPLFGHCRSILGSYAFSCKIPDSYAFSYTFYPSEHTAKVILCSSNTVFTSG